MSRPPFACLRIKWRASRKYCPVTRNIQRMLFDDHTYFIRQKDDDQTCFFFSSSPQNSIHSEFSLCWGHAPVPFRYRSANDKIIEIIFGVFSVSRQTTISANVRTHSDIIWRIKYIIYPRARVIYYFFFVHCDRKPLNILRSKFFNSILKFEAVKLRPQNLDQIHPTRKSLASSHTVVMDACQLVWSTLFRPRDIRNLSCTADMWAANAMRVTILFIAVRAGTQPPNAIAYRSPNHLFNA